MSVSWFSDYCKGPHEAPNESGARTPDTNMLQHILVREVCRHSPFVEARVRQALKGLQPNEPLECFSGAPAIRIHMQALRAYI